MAKNFTHTQSAGNSKETLAVSGTSAEISQGVNEITDAMLWTYLPVGTQTSAGTFTFTQHARVQNHVNQWLTDGKSRPHTII